eukprot:gene29756-38897_t
MIPATIPHLEKYISNYEQERRDELVSSTKDRKERKKALATSKFLNELNLLLNEFESVITSSIEESRDIRLWVHITLGPTISNPRETYCMHFLSYQNNSNRSPPPPLTLHTEAERSARIRRLEKVLVRRFLEFSFKNNSESSAIVSYGPAVTSKWNFFISATILHGISPVPGTQFAVDCMIEGKTPVEQLLTTEAADSSIVTGGDMFCYREGGEFNLKQKPWNWPYDSHTARKTSSSSVTDGFEQLGKSSSEHIIEEEEEKKRKTKSVTMTRKKASSNHPVEVTIDCCLGTISECSISKPTRDDMDGECADGDKGPMATCTPPATHQLEAESEKGDQEWAVSHWWVQRKGMKGIPERIYAV